MSVEKKYLHNIDLVNNKLINPLLNPLTTAQRTAVGTLLTALDQGYVCFDTTQNIQYFWNGLAWVTVTAVTSWGNITGAITNQLDLTAYLSANYYPLSTNPAGYLTSATANLLYYPLSSNPSGYLTSSALTPYLTSATAASTYVPLTRNITINGITQNLLADRTWTITIPPGGVTAVTASTPLASSGGTTPNITIQQSSGSANGYLSSTDWTTFNSKQNTISLTTTGTSGAATFISNTLNIPQYQAAGTYVTSVGATGPITSSGGTTPTISTSMATNKLIGRSTAGTGVMEEITVGTGLSLSGGTLSATATGILHGVASGTDTYAATITGPTSYADGDAYLIRFTIGNTSSATLNINGLGAKSLYRNNDGPLLGGDIEDGGEMLCVYNSTLNGFQCIGTSPNTLLAYVTNDDSVTITKGQAVYAFSGAGDRMTVKRAVNTGDSTSAQTVGLVWSTSILPNQKGFIMMQGLLDGLSILPTSIYDDGDAVYLGSTPGAITNTKPYAPNHLVYLGVVTTANNGSSGRMYVKVQNGYELDELHNVQAQSPTVNDVLYYFGGTPGQWKTASISAVLGYTPANSTRNISTSAPLTGGGDLTADRTLSITQATTSTNGYLSSTDWNTFNNKQGALTLTTLGSTGTATLVGNTLNVPQYIAPSSNLFNYYNFI
jgi:hypothetical protein